MTRPKCESCYYLGKQESNVHGEGKHDVCKRNAPVPIADDQAEVVYTRWPPVQPLIDWCGEHHWSAESGPADD